MPESLQQGPQAHNENYRISDQTHASFTKNYPKSQANFFPQMNAANFA
jgi:hypothetical protein